LACGLRNEGKNKWGSIGQYLDSTFVKYSKNWQLKAFMLVSCCALACCIE